MVRFVDGEYRAEPAGGPPADCIISADPTAYLLVGTGRLSLGSAILGLLSAGGTAGSFPATSHSTTSASSSSTLARNGLRLYRSSTKRWATVSRRVEVRAAFAFALD